MSQNDLTIKKRNLPHWFLGDSVYFITFRTKGITLLEEDRAIILQHIVEGNNNFYTLFGAVIMPDHCHIILKPDEKYSLSRILKGIKGVTARKINVKRNEKGSLWMDESFDRIIRDEVELIEKMNYILYNPVKNGLVDDPILYKGLYINYDAL
jgi:REP element-mobilizing transposase RayT